MANESSMSDVPVVLASADTEQSIAIDAARWHHLEHFSTDANGSPAVSPVFLAFQRGSDAVTVDADNTPAANKWILRPGMTLQIPPGIGRIVFKSDGDDPTFGINPLPPDLWA